MEVQAFSSLISSIIYEPIGWEDVETSIKGYRSWAVNIQPPPRNQYPTMDSVIHAIDDEVKKALTALDQGQTKGILRRNNSHIATFHESTYILSKSNFPQ